MGSREETLVPKLAATATTCTDATEGLGAPRRPRCSLRFLFILPELQELSPSALPVFDVLDHCANRAAVGVGYRATNRPYVLQEGNEVELELDAPDQTAGHLSQFALGGCNIWARSQP